MYVGGYCEVATIVLGKKNERKESTGQGQKNYEMEDGLTRTVGGGDAYRREEMK
jgi:hypothetical protein